MEYPWLGQGYRDRTGEISDKHGNTEIGILRKIYGAGFAKGFSETATLWQVFVRLDPQSVSELCRNYEDGSLGKKIRQAEKLEITSRHQNLHL